MRERRFKLLNNKYTSIIAYHIKLIKEQMYCHVLE
jgi:hypothetical protein